MLAAGAAGSKRVFADVIGESTSITVSSSMAGVTSTAAKDVWRRPAESNGLMLISR